MSSKSTDADIRPLTAGDLEAVIAIDKFPAGVSRRGYFEKRLAAATDRPKDYVYVGLYDGEVLVGFAFAKLVSGNFGLQGATASIDAIGVGPDHSDRGLGSLLLEAIERILVAKKVAILTSQVDWTNSAILGFLSKSGFQLSPRMILTTFTSSIPAELLEKMYEAGMEPDFGVPGGDDVANRSDGKIPIRSLVSGDLRAVISIDKKITGNDRFEYYQRMHQENLQQSGVRVSLIAEIDDYPVGFIMARVDYGEFGHAAKEAEMDAIGIDPEYQGKGVGLALMAQLFTNLAVLNVDTIRTELDWDSVDLISYLSAFGFTPAQRLTLQKKLS